MTWKKIKYYTYFINNNYGSFVLQFNVCNINQNVLFKLNANCISRRNKLNMFSDRKIIFKKLMLSF